MADPQRSHEPTMEEILASIRRIISDDETAGEPAAEEEAPEESAGASDDDYENSNEDIDALFADSADETAAEADEDEADLAEPEAGDDDVFELTDEMAAPKNEEEEGGGEDLDALLEEFDAAGGEVEDAGIEDDLEFQDRVEDIEPEPGREPERAPVMHAAPPAEPSALLSSDAQSAVSAAFGALASTMLSHSGGARTLEQIVEDLLRPLLKRWLDENLPPLVERLVREEIERVARHAR